VTGRRALPATVALCLAGSALAWFAATRTWQAADGSPVRTGADVFPGLSAVALVGLAGAGAVLATRRLGRRLVGVLVALVGLTLGGAGVVGLGRADNAWPLLCAAGGLLVIVGGLATVARGHRWPGMGTRYDRAARTEREGPRDAWEALDRGEDPTLS
jgi:tryptophan-associated transmembrane protein